MRNILIIVSLTLLSCNPPQPSPPDEVPVAVCGNGITEPDEECDIEVPWYVRCTDFGFTSGDVNKCSSNCMADLSDCYGHTSGSYCGDGIVDEGEECDFAGEYWECPLPLGGRCNRCECN